MEKQLVTIGITCFNAEETIKRAIKSALGQDWQNIEILIVDDCSTDSSVEIITKAITNDSRARLIKHVKNCGPAGARNTILDQACGEFIAFFDDDDESMPGRIFGQVEVLTLLEKKIKKNLIACYASGERIYSNGHKKILYAIGSQNEEVPHGEGVADYLLFFKRDTRWFYGAGTPTCALLARRSTFAIAGGFDNNLRRVEDVDFAIRLSLMGGYFVGTTKTLLRQFSTNAPDKKPELNLKAEQDVVDKFSDYLIKKKIYYYAYKWPLLRYYYFKKKYLMLVFTFMGIFIRYPFLSVKHFFKTGGKRLLHDFRISR